ncbi:hypothetical protein [Roseococcus pinisoli]|uniref:Uncharacterized protein n=1 Tax=Roseococcus pinisoli TaxID=2835040 RepID=A0ABS5QAH6_9PROT|nr:hypothetical protein [Roseococcus pinisoli]MBS7810508.1 hypothetical protein [Roseococcus pinisoli]
MMPSLAAQLERALTDVEQLQTSLHAAHGMLREARARLTLHMLSRCAGAPLKLSTDQALLDRIDRLLPRVAGANVAADRDEDELDRAAAAVAEAIVTAPEDEDRQEAAACAAASAIAAVPRLERKGNRGRLPSTWTDERLRLLDAEGHNISQHGKDLLARVNALEGPPCASVGAMRVKYRLRLDAGLIKPPTAPAAKPAPAKPSTIPEEDKAEARQMIQQGRGALDLVAWFGWDLSEAQDFAEAVRAEPRKSAA